MKVKFKKREDLSWRRLDNYAKLFPLASTRKYSSVFRLSIVLKEKISVSVCRNYKVSEPGCGLCQKTPARFSAEHIPFLRGLLFCHIF